MNKRALFCVWHLVLSPLYSIQDRQTTRCQLPTKEKYRGQGEITMIETLFQDLRFGLRMLAKSPGFTAVAILSLTLGIGANTAIFSLVNTAALRPLPVARPNELMSLKNANGSKIDTGFSYLNYKDFRDRNDVF